MSGTTLKEAVRQVRRGGAQLRATRKALEQVQASLAAPSPEELAAMAEGGLPLSAEAYLLAVLEAAIAELENLENDLRLNVSAWAFSRLERNWQLGNLPAERDLRRIRSALNARNRPGGNVRP